MGLSKPPKIYWDSCAWLGLINGEPDKRRELEILYGAARKGQYEIWTSTFSIVEVVRLKEEQGRPRPLDAASLAKIDEILFQNFVKLIPMDVDVARRSRAMLRELTGLGKKPDAVHLASAVKWNIPVFHTYDNEDLLHLDGKVNCANGSAMSICYPDLTTDGGLFAKAKRT